MCPMSNTALISTIRYRINRVGTLPHLLCFRIWFNQCYRGSTKSRIVAPIMRGKLPQWYCYPVTRYARHTTGIPFVSHNTVGRARLGTCKDRVAGRLPFLSSELNRFLLLCLLYGLFRLTIPPIISYWPKVEPWSYCLIASNSATSQISMNFQKWSWRESNPRPASFQNSSLQAF